MPQTGDPRRLHIVLDARLASGTAGGIEGVLIGLAHGLSQLEGPEAYDFVTLAGQSDWLEPHVSGSARITQQQHPPAPKPRARPGLSTISRRAMRAARQALRRQKPVGSRPHRDRFIEGLSPDLVHMVIQRGFLATVPSIYHPHDLQHVHLPEFFTAEQRAWRERWYGELCRRAAMVAVSSEWTRSDVAEHFGLSRDTVRLVPLAPPLAATRAPADRERAEIRARFRLPERYVIYAAQTWPHKNHLGLLEALARLHTEHDLVVPLVATGHQTEHFSQLLEASRALAVEDQVVWTGFVPPLELHVLLQDATAVVIPSLFEAASAPLWEAFAAGVPAACSNVTSLPEQAGEAALVFDPLDHDAIANAIATLWRDDDVRGRLVARGRERVAELSWEQTARIFRAHYRRLAGASMNDEDRALTRA